jgi:hypothetical protein
MTDNAAENIVDPLDGLAEKVAADPGAPFAPEVLVQLCELKREDRSSSAAIPATSGRPRKKLNSLSVGFR